MKFQKLIDIKHLKRNAFKKFVVCFHFMFFNIINRGVFLKKTFFLAALPKLVMVATNLAPNFDLEDFF